MKQTFLVLGILVLFSVLLTGGFTTSDPQPFNTIGSFAAEFANEGGIKEEKTLQIQALKPVTPTPTPPGTTPTPSPTGACQPGRRVAVDLLLDTSGSMNSSSKINLLKGAVIQFAGNLRPDDVIGVQQFSSPIDLGGTGARDVISIGPYNQTLFNQVINQLSPTNGFTHMRAGFELTRQRINAGRQQYSSSNYNWVLIFLSDGIPEDESVVSSVPVFAESQNPTDIANQLKVDTRIITIGLDMDAFRNAGYPNITDQGRNLLRSLASAPTSQNYIESPTGIQLQSIFNNLNSSVVNCQ